MEWLPRVLQRIVPAALLLLRLQHPGRERQHQSSIRFDCYQCQQCNCIHCYSWRVDSTISADLRTSKALVESGEGIKRKQEEVEPEPELQAGPELEAEPEPEYTVARRRRRKQGECARDQRAEQRSDVQGK